MLMQVLDEFLVLARSMNRRVNRRVYVYLIIVKENFLLKKEN